MRDDDSAPGTGCPTVDGPRARSPVSLADLRHAQDVLTWLREYISMPHPELGRGGPVCPFVPQSLRADQVRLVLHGEIDGSDPAALRELLLHYLGVFLADPPRSPVLRRQRSLVVVLPAVAGENIGRLAEIHRAVKSDMVRNGAMIGQFYRGCPETAVRNPGFHVSTGPVPCYVIRHMAPHDVLFLHEDADWFAEYHSRFAAEYAAGKVSDPLMVQLFERAERGLQNR